MEENYDWQDSFALTSGTKEQQEYYKNLFNTKIMPRIEGEQDYFTAEEARKVSEEISNGNMHKELDWIYGLINDARFDGKREITVSNKTLYNSTKEFLKSKGFKISYFYGDQRDPANDTTISW
jgi:hypothetical protein